SRECIFAASDLERPARGFTLIELLTAVGVIVVLAGNWRFGTRRHAAPVRINRNIRGRCPSQRVR
ncbi:MAG: prepilin-type N-terminal cleavage/methylation domain-containing protein, partial [Verrucomicrobiae bacterium]|nr:prepilin-type N-terminal cleavage/methylation domain-containing protein [Verrucomicrobiae bacterium]